MKKVIVLFAVILAFAANSFAQNGSQIDNQSAIKTDQTKMHRGGKHADGMTMQKELNLTTEQSNSLKDIGNAYKGKMQALRSDNSLTKEQKMTKMKELRQSHDNEVKGVLNADQYAKLSEMKKQHGGRGNMNMQKELNLTPEQSNSLKTIGNTYKGKMQALRTDNSLSKEQKMAKMKELGQSHDAEVKGVLNADQYTKFTELKKQRHDNMKAHKGGHKGKNWNKSDGTTPSKSN